MSKNFPYLRLTNSEILEIIKGTITKGDINSLFNFIRAISRQAKNGLINIDNLNTILLKYKIEFSPKNIKKLGILFATEEIGVIKVEEFVQTIVGEMNAERADKVEQIFTKLDQDNDGFITTQEILSKFDASKNAEVIAKKKTEKQILAQFMDAVDTFFSLIVIFTSNL